MSIDSSFVAGFLVCAVFVVALIVTLGITECPTRTKEHRHD